MEKTLADIIEENTLDLIERISYEVDKIQDRFDILDDEFVRLKK